MFSKNKLILFVNLFENLIVERKYLNSTIGTLLNVLLKKAEAQAKNESNVTVDQSLQSAS